MATDAAGRTLHCVVEQSLRIQEQDYGILSPVDTPAYLCRWPADDAAEEPRLIADPHQYPQVLDELDTILREEDLFLVRSAGLLTVGGDLKDFPVEVGLDDNDDDDVDSCFALASARHGGAEFDLYGSLDPCFLVARLQQGGTAELLAPDALAKLQPLIEEALGQGEEVGS